MPSVLMTPEKNFYVSEDDRLRRHADSPRKPRVASFFVNLVRRGLLHDQESVETIQLMDRRTTRVLHVAALNSIGDDWGIHSEWASVLLETIKYCLTRAPETASCTEEEARIVHILEISRCKLDLFLKAVDVMRSCHYLFGNADDFDPLEDLRALL